MNFLNAINNSNKNLTFNNKTNFDISSYKIPYVDSPFYKEMSKNCNSKFLTYCNKLNSDGYCVLDIGIDNEVIHSINSDIDSAVEKKIIKLNSKAYHYNYSPRIVEAWKFSKGVKNLSANKKILDFLRFAYKSDPIPFSTINFIRGTEQPFHSDEFHFGSVPHRYLSGCWIALEDIHEDSGPLSIVVGSHKLPIFSFESIGLEIPKNEKDFKRCYTIYEEWVKEIIKAYDFEIVTPKLKKGQCIVWLSNTLHGAFKINNSLLTRKSLVVHYHYDKCEMLFYPNYSDLLKGKFIKRPRNGIDIRYH